MLRRLLAIACMAGFALATPLPAAAADSFTCSVSPTTHGAWATLTCTLTVSKPVTSEQWDFPSGSSFCHHGDTCSPPDNTVIGTTSEQAVWLYNLCVGTSTQTFNDTWVANDGSYTPPTGWSIVAQVNAVSTLATVKTWIIEDAAGDYEVVTPSEPNLTCSGHSTTTTFTWGTDNGHTYDIYRNPATVGTFTITVCLTFTDNSTECLSATYTTT